MRDPKTLPDEEARLDIPPAWEQIDFAGLHGPLLVIGAPDKGKTSFARFLFQRLNSLKDGKVAFLDGDPGQSRLGPPATMTLAFSLSVQTHVWRYFVGSTSPRGHMLPIVVGAARLVQVAQMAEAQAIVYDTSGMIDPVQGGLALKSAKIDLLRPAFVFAIQQDQELEPLLVPLRRSGRAKVVSLRPSGAARRRNPNARRAHRSRQYAGYFKRGTLLKVEWTKLAVFPFPRFRLNQLVALEDREGFALGLGIVIEIDRDQRQVVVLTPLGSLKEVVAIRLGDLLLDPETFEDTRLSE